MDLNGQRRLKSTTGLFVRFLFLWKMNIRYLYRLKLALLPAFLPDLIFTATHKFS